MKTVKVIFNLEEDFRIEVYDERGFKESSHDINQSQLGEEIDTICSLATTSDKEKEDLKSTLRTCYQLGLMKNLQMKIGG